MKDHFENPQESQAGEPDNVIEGDFPGNYAALISELDLDLLRATPVIEFDEDLARKCAMPYVIAIREESLRRIIKEEGQSELPPARVRSILAFRAAKKRSSEPSAE